ncbi:MAG: putative lipid II flippase FtsW [Aquisalimonadaceae bacterium]
MSAESLFAVRIRARAPALLPNLDTRLLGAMVIMSVLGLIMVASASISLAERNLGSPFHYLERQLLFLGMGYTLGWFALNIRLSVWQRCSGLGLLAALALLVLVLVPGIGREVNGSTRWIPLGIFNLQVSEVAKLAVMVYLAGWLVRHGEQVRRTMVGFMIPMSVLGLVGLLLLMEPDFGAAVVIIATGMGMLFLGGVPVWRFAVVMLGAVGVGVALILGSPYRWNRLTAFVNPWDDPFNSGFQLTQSLIAIGRGEWLGVGLGGSVQKLFYLPEAHTDFVFAVMAEELGLLGVVAVVLLFGYICWRTLTVGAKSMRAGRPFAGYLCFGIGIWLGLQAFINIGVNMGLLPTKGLTLPLMSYGGSSLLMTLVALALVLRADHELRVRGTAARPVKRRASNDE